MTGRAVPNAAVFSLGEPGEVDPSPVFTGPLTGIRRVRLGPGEIAELSAIGNEFSFFVLAGDGTAHADSTEVPLHEGISVTAPLGTVLSLAAGTHGIEYFLVELTVPDRGAG